MYGTFTIEHIPGRREFSPWLGIDDENQILTALPFWWVKKKNLPSLAYGSVASCLVMPQKIPPRANSLNLWIWPYLK